MGRSTRALGRRVALLSFGALLATAAAALARSEARRDTAHRGTHHLELVDIARQGDEGLPQLAGLVAAGWVAPDRAWALARDADRLVALQATRDGLVPQQDLPATGATALATREGALVTAGPDALRAYDATGALLQTLAGGAAAVDLVDGPGTPLLLAFSNDTLRIFSWGETLQLLGTLRDPALRGARDGARSPTGALLVASPTDNALLEVALGPQPRVVTRHTGHPGLDGVVAVATTSDGAVWTAGFCDHRVSRFEPEPGGLRFVAATAAAAPPGCQEPGEVAPTALLFPTSLAPTGPSAVATAGLNALLVAHEVRWEAGALTATPLLDAQPGWLDYARFDWAAPETRRDGPPLPPDRTAWRDAATVNHGAAGLLVVGRVPDALAWRDPEGHLTTLHKGQGGTARLAGAYNLELSPTEPLAVVAPRAEVSVTVGAFALTPDGLVEVGVAPVPGAAAGDGAMLNVAPSPDGRLVYAVDADFGGVHAYRVGAGGLAPAARQQLPPCGDNAPMAVDIVTSRGGSELYVADFQWTGPGCIHVLPVGDDGLPGAVVQTVQSDALRGVEALAPTPDGGQVLAACHLSRSLTLLSRAESGTLTVEDAVTRADLDGAEFVVVSPDGRNAYVSSPVSDTVVAFSRSPLTGTWRHLQTVSAPDGLALTDAAGLTLSPDGTHLAVAARVSDTVTLFARDRQGRLTPEDSATGPHLNWVNGVAMREGEGGVDLVAAAVAASSLTWLRVVDGPAP